MKNVKQLRDSLLELYGDLKNDKCEIEKAKVMVSAGNSIIKSASIELEYAKFTGNKKNIEFLE